MPDYIHRKTVLDTIRRNSMLRVQDIYDAVESLPVVNVGQERGTPDILHCSECYFYREDAWQEVNGVPVITGHNLCIRWGNGCVTKPEGFCHMARREAGEDTNASTKPYDFLYEEGGVNDG